MFAPRVKSNFCDDFVTLIDALDDNLNYLVVSNIVNYFNFITFADGDLLSLVILT